MNTRHEGADTRAVSVERSDVIDAAAGLYLLARETRRDARSRRNSGLDMVSYRSGLRRTADIYEAAAKRMQRAADESF